jgi:uncharacterized protein (DUF488 family)
VARLDDRAISPRYRPIATITLFTIGHGTRPVDELIAVLRASGVAELVDVRRYPGSRRNPQFGRDALAASVDDAGLVYEWCEALGGRRRGHADSPNVAWRDPSFRAYADYLATPEFRAAFGELVDGAAVRPTAVMCSETLWWRCHRRLIADTAVAAGCDVVHLGAGKPQRHRLDPSARASRDGTLVYDRVDHTGN